MWKVNIQHWKWKITFSSCYVIWVLKSSECWTTYKRYPWRLFVSFSRSRILRKYFWQLRNSDFNLNYKIYSWLLFAISKELIRDLVNYNPRTIIEDISEKTKYWQYGYILLFKNNLDTLWYIEIGHELLQWHNIFKTL